MASDITSAILEYYVANFQTYVNEGLTAGDPLYLKEILRAPLQDDPTERSYFLTIEPDPTLAEDNMHWRMPVTAIKRGMLATNQDAPEHLVGGNFLMINFFLIKGQMFEAVTREDAYSLGGAALRRIERAQSKIAHDIMNGPGIETDDGLETTATYYPQIFNMDGGHFELGGGETTWFPKLSLRFHVFTEIDRSYWGL